MQVINFWIVENLKNILNICPIKKIQLYNFDITLVVETKHLLNILLFFKNHLLCQYNILSCISAVDYPFKKFRFMIVYELLSIRFNHRIKVKIFSHELLFLNSVGSIFLSASWYEAEIWDLFGVFFKNHINLKRILTDYGFEGFPLRKNFPLSGFLEFRYNETKKRVINEFIELSQEYRTFNFISPWKKQQFTL